MTTCLSLALLLLASGCQQKLFESESVHCERCEAQVESEHVGEAQAAQDRAQVHVTLSKEDHVMTLDGKLNEEVWRSSQRHVMAIAKDQSGEILEGGSVSFLMDRHHLYIGFDLVDTDVVQESDRDQDKHFLSGDLIELFIKPTDEKYYWEIYITPNDKKSIFHFLGPGRGFLPSSYLGDPSSIGVKAHVRGSMNDPSDVDDGWSGEMKLPLELFKKGAKSLSMDGEWSILIGRYNYSIHLPKVELSTQPLISQEYFHLVDEWARLRFQP